MKARAAQGSLTVVSAASFEASALAPGSIAAGFGVQLATTTAIADKTPLPTDIAGTKVEVNGVPAGLFFVSPMQVNFQIPEGTPTDVAVSVKVTSGDGTISIGEITARNVAPAIFTANSNGQGVPAALLLRVRADGTQQYEDLFMCAGNPAVCIPVPIDPAGEGERLFLVLFISGTSKAVDPNMDGNFNEIVHIVLGGTELIPLFAGKHPSLVGVEQINCELPGTMSGWGKLNLAIAGTGFAASNITEIEIASPKTASPPVIVDFNPKMLLAGEMLSIDATGFSQNAADLRVRISGVEARIVSVEPGRIVVNVPFGACSGRISLWDRNSGEGFSDQNLTIRTSISGFIEDTNRRPLSGVLVRLIGSNIIARTGIEGSFILPDVNPGNADLEIDGTSLLVAQSFPKIKIRKIVSANCDNLFSRPISLQQSDGENIVISAINSAPDQLFSVPADTSSSRLASGTAILEIPAGATVTFPDGMTSGVLTVTMVGNGRPPVNLPLGVFSSTIVQITPFGSTISPGAKLIFPNTDNIMASTARLYRFDQDPAKQTFGRFVDAGPATVSGSIIETSPDAIKETGYYFVAVERETTTVIGHVNDSDGATPVRLAVVRERGEEGFTDGNGGLILRHVPVNPSGDQIMTEASFVRPTGRIDRTHSQVIPPVVKGITTVRPDLILPSETDNRPPIIVAPASLIINAGEDLRINFIAYDPDGDQMLDLQVTGAPFASISHLTAECYQLNLAPAADAAGTYTLTVTATDGGGSSFSYNISLSVNTSSIICGQTVTGNLTSVTQKDVYNFSGKAGDEVVLTGIGTSGFVCALIEIYEPGNNTAPIKRVNCNNTTGKMRLPKDGRYTIVVSESGLDRTGTYDLNLQFADGRCGKMIECGQTVKTALSKVAQYDTYTFKGKTGDPVIITVIGTSGFVCTWFEIYTPAGSLLKQVNCNNTADILVLPDDGIYTVLVHESGFDRTGNYDINLQFADGRCGSAIACGEISGKTLDSITQYDVHTFEAKTDDDVIITGIGTSGFVCVLMDIYSPSWQLIKQVNCNNTTDPLKLPEDGEYRIIIHESGFDRTGNYDLNLQFLDGRCGRLIQYGQTLMGEFKSVTQHDVYYFDGSANDTINLTAKGTSGLVCAEVTIYEPDIMTELEMSHPPCDTSTPNLTLVSTGRRYILVREQGFDRVGTYDINLTRIGALQTPDRR
ncbi:MAG: hypothetical protein IPM66_17090 [Acidobacteriota bacterium]|nr:MAG: hypothetical protein IPM66_17090 [Acidobacteriota bacterium]